MVKLEQPSFQKLLQHINQTYPHLPTDYTLTYLDHDQDEICISSDEDLAIMLSAGNKYSKVYVKESLSQVLDMSSYMTGDVQLEVYESKIGEAKVEEKEPIKENLKVEVRVDAEKEESVASRKSSGWSVPAEIEVDSRPEAREVFKVE